MPNFGYEGDGDNTYGINNKIVGSVFTCPSNGFAKSITARIHDGEGVSVRCLMYKHSDLSLVAETEQISVNTGVGSEWIIFHIPEPAPPVVSGVAYCLEAWAGIHHGDGTAFYRLDAGDVDQAHYQTINYDGAPDPLVATHGNRKYSVYCTYEADPAPVGSFPPRKYRIKKDLFRDYFALKLKAEN